MKDRVMMIAAAVMAAACIGLTLLVMSALQEGRRVNEAILAKLEAAGSGENSQVDLEWGALELQLVHPAGGAGSLSGIEVELTGNAINPSEGALLTQRTNDEGAVEFSPIRPGTFTLRVFGEGGLYHERLVVVMPGGEQVEELAWPRFPLAEVSFAVEWPEDLRDKDLRLYCELTPRNTRLALEGTEWKLPRQLVLMLDADGGVLAHVNSRADDTDAEFPAEAGPGGWVESAEGTPGSGTATLVAQFYKMASATVFCRSSGPAQYFEHSFVQAAGTAWSDHTAPNYRASIDGSSNRWRIQLPDHTIGSLRRSAPLAGAFLKDRLAAAGYGTTVQRLPITEAYWRHDGTELVRVDNARMVVQNKPPKVQLLLR